eukprot:TCONS_00053206-protein
MDLSGSFISSFESSTREFFTSCLTKSELLYEERVRLTNTLASYECQSLLSVDSLKSVIQTLAHFILVVKPFHACALMRDGAEVISKDFDMLTEECLQGYAKAMRPNGSDIIEKLKPTFDSESQIFKKAEQRCFVFLQNFIEELSQSEASIFMKFVTGMEMMQEKINVTFNGQDNPQMMLPR